MGERRCSRRRTCRPGSRPRSSRRPAAPASTRRTGAPPFGAAVVRVAVAVAPRHSCTRWEAPHACVRRRRGGDDPLTVWRLRAKSERVSDQLDAESLSD